ncbi:MAG: hypothetical protein STHCBS139747_006576 [Sporothrix thermara]
MLGWLRSRVSPTDPFVQLVFNYIITAALLLSVAWRDPCDPDRRVVKVSASQALTAGFWAHTTCNIYYYYRGSNGASHAGPRLALSVLGASLAAAATYYYEGNKIRRLIPYGCVCYDDDGNVTGRGGDILDL